MVRYFNLAGITVGGQTWSMQVNASNLRDAEEVLVARHARNDSAFDLPLLFATIFDTKSNKLHTYRSSGASLRRGSVDKVAR